MDVQTGLLSRRNICMSFMLSYHNQESMILLPISSEFSCAVMKQLSGKTRHPDIQSGNGVLVSCLFSLIKLSLLHIRHNGMTWTM